MIPKSASPRAAQPSVLARRVQWFWSLSLAGRGVVIGLVAVALFAAFYSEENWRGKRTWEACRRDLAARGVELDWSKFAPPPVPDDQNFAMTPFLAPLFDFNPRPIQPGQTWWRDTVGYERASGFGAALLPMDKLGRIAPARCDGQMSDLQGALLVRIQSNSAAGPAPDFPTRAAAADAVLQTFAEYQPVLEELRAASRRAYCRFNIEYNAEDPMTILLPHMLVLERVCNVLQLRSSAELALEKTSEAFDDVGLMIFLAESIRAEPFAICWRARAYMLTEVEQIVWEGLAQRRWSEPQLQALQMRLNETNLMMALSRCLQAERASFGGLFFRFVRTHKNSLRGWIASDDSAGGLAYLLVGPEGWFYQEEATFHRFFQDRLLAGFDLRTGHVRPHVIEASRKTLESDMSGWVVWRHTAVSKLMLGNLMELFAKAALAQNRLELAATACAVERCRLVQGKLPENLNSLVPQFLDTVPVDICDGRPLKYRALAKDKLLLYGVGWNETDEGGQVVMNKEGTAPAVKEGDWVWPAYPAN